MNRLSHCQSEIIVHRKTKKRLTRKDYSSNWEIISAKIRQEKPYCEQCGNPKQKNNVLTVHHIDGNPMNNRCYNLSVLCQKCHLKIQNAHIPLLKPKPILILGIPWKT